MLLIQNIGVNQRPPGTIIERNTETNQTTEIPPTEAWSRRFQAYIEAQTPILTQQHPEWDLFRRGAEMLHAYQLIDPNPNLQTQQFMVANRRTKEMREELRVGNT